MTHEEELKKEKTSQRMERLKKAVAYLISIERISQKSIQKDIAEQMGYNNKVTISNALNGNIRYLTESFITRFSDTFENIFNLTWLLEGEGSMFSHNYQEKENIIEITADDIQPKTTTRIIDNEDDLKEAIDKGIKLLPEVDFKFAAGQIELINGAESIKRYWFLPDCKDCEAVAQIAGSSMSPAYPSGCWVALKKHGFSAETATQIPFGNVFGIVIQDQFTGDYHGHIKVLRRYKDQELSRKYWIAHSLNEDEYDDFDIEIAQVRSLWIVKQHIVSDILL